MNYRTISHRIPAGSAALIALAPLVCGPAALAAAPGDLAARLEALEKGARNIDFVWTLVAAALVLLMQAGFMLVEAGMVRSKNAVNVAQKNMLDFAVSVAVFALFGFMLAFGVSHGPLFGGDHASFLLNDLDDWGLAFFVFQVMFCGTAATIVSGAVAERMKLSAYIVCSAVVAGLIYPVFVHWAWGTALHPNPSAILANLGFIDFAGSTVVHSTGAWVALAACLVLGARSGRFDSDGRPVRIHGHSPVLATAGALLLFVGWIGFNGGSTTAARPEIASIIANTVLAAASGTAAGYVITLMQDGAALPEKTVSGLLGGLVAITAGCAVVNAQGALLIGIIGGVAAVGGNWLLEHKVRIDDAVGAIGVHGFAGVAGTLALVFLAAPDLLPAGSRYDQLKVQGLGVVLNFVWSFGLGLIFFKLLDLFWTMRSSARDEIMGLNQAEHGARLGVGHVEDALTSLVDGEADLGMRLPVVPGDESENLTRLFNALMDNIQNEEYSKVSAAEAQRQAEESERLSALADNAFEAILISVDNRIVDGNRALADLLGIPLEAIKGRALSDLFAPGDWPKLAENVCRADSAPLEASLIDREGAAIPVEFRGREILYRETQTQVIAISDLRERKIAEERIRYLAHHDPLTGLPNRAVFQDRLAVALERTSRNGAKTAVFLVDLDRFKDINDLHGHPAGDAVIKATAERLKKVVRGMDTVARLGGDEFAIIQSDIAFDNQAADLAHRLLRDLAGPVDVGGLQLPCAASIGIAIAPRDGTDADALVSKADTALYRAKQAGRNDYCLFEEGMDAALKKRRMLDADLAHAIDRDQFELHFQPQIDLAGRRLSGYEALLRWRHPEMGMISPADFIPVAEESGKILRIGEWVLREACSKARDLDPSIVMSVNVSPVQFRDKAFVQTVSEVLDQEGLEPARLEIEVTESVLIDDDARAITMLRELKKLGLRIALDDFGTGYSSLSYLSTFPFDKIKIDRAFVHGGSKSQEGMAIIKTIIRLGRALNMQIVAEGVENAEDVKLLAREGCTIIQGFYFGKPKPGAEIGSLARWTALDAKLACLDDTSPPARVA